MQHVNPFVELNIGSAVNSTRQQLNALTDEQLHDLGMERGQIDDVARGLVGRMSQPLRRAFARRPLSLSPLFRAYVTA